MRRTLIVPKFGKFFWHVLPAVAGSVQQPFGSSLSEAEALAAAEKYLSTA